MAVNKTSIIHLAEVLADHQGVTHWAISQRIFGKGRFFSDIKNGGDCLTKSAERAHNWFGKNWPKDLEWPETIERPERQIHEGEVA